MNTLTEKTIWISGAARGIGRAIALAVVQDGGHVVFGDIDEDGIAETVALADRIAPRRAVGIVCDFADRAAWTQIEAATPGDYPALHALIHNVGVNPGTYFDETPLESEETASAINLHSARLGIRQALPHLKTTGGAILFINSIMLECNAARATSYSTDKGALVGLARALAVELAPHRIRVNSLLPGYIMLEPPDFYRQKVPPPLWSRFSETFQSEWEGCFQAAQPFPEAGRTRDVAAAALFLLSDVARFITGVELPVDGGTSRVGLRFNPHLHAPLPWTSAMQAWVESQ